MAAASSNFIVSADADDQTAMRTTRIDARRRAMIHIT
jgi:hypothetical protein